MDRIALKKANNLEEIITYLENFMVATRPDYCNGVGVKAVPRKNREDDYAYRLFCYTCRDTYKKNKSREECLSSKDIIIAEIMYAGIEAMHNKAAELLVECEKMFDSL